jgi:hypothetical protein
MKKEHILQTIIVILILALGFLSVNRETTPIEDQENQLTPNSSVVDQTPLSPDERVDLPIELKRAIDKAVSLEIVRLTASDNKKDFTLSIGLTITEILHVIILLFCFLIGMILAITDKYLEAIIIGLLMITYTFIF